MKTKTAPKKTEKVAIKLDLMMDFSFLERDLLKLLDTVKKLAKKKK